MKIEIEIPDWAEGRHIYVMAGIELLAYKYAGEPLKVKTGRCNLCGQCCEFKKDFPDSHPRVINRKCEFLVKQGNTQICSLGSNRPVSCSVGVHLKNREGCTEMFEEV